MANISFNRLLENQQQYRSSAAWLHILGTADARGAEVLLEYTSDCTLTQEVEAYDPQDDSGQVINHREVVKSAKLEMKIMAQDAKVRQMFTGTGDQSLKGKYFGITLQLADFSAGANVAPTVTGYITFFKCYISQAATINFGSNDVGYMLTAYCLPNKSCATYTATLPTGPCFKPVAVSAAIGADEFYATEDGAWA